MDSWENCNGKVDWIFYHGIQLVAILTTTFEFLVHEINIDSMMYIVMCISYPHCIVWKYLHPSTLIFKNKYEIPKKWNNSKVQGKNNIKQRVFINIFEFLTKNLKKLIFYKSVILQYLIPTLYPLKEKYLLTLHYNFNLKLCPILFQI